MGPGETYTYDLRFPDPGIFWYHPHVPQDYGQEQGLYGAILVEPIEPGYWARLWTVSYLSYSMTS